MNDVETTTAPATAEPHSPSESAGDDRGQQGKGGRGQVVIIALVLATLLAAIGGFTWNRQQQQLAAAEAEAKSQITKLGGLALSGETRDHVGSLNLSLVTDDEKFDRAMALAADLHWLQVLDLTKRPVTAEQLAKLTVLPQLASLHLAQTPIGDEAAEVLAKFSGLSALHVSDTELTSDALSSIGKLSKLKVLDLSGTNISGGYEALGGLKELTWLVLRGVPINDAATETLAGLPALSRLSLEAGQMTDEQRRRLRNSNRGVKVDGIDPAEDSEH